MIWRKEHPEFSPRAAGKGLIRPEFTWKTWKRGAVAPEPSPRHTFPLCHNGRVEQSHSIEEGGLRGGSLARIGRLTDVVEGSYLGLIV